MLGDISVADEIYMVCGYTDMRRSMDGLCAIVQDRLKALLWEGDDFLLLYKRMEAQGVKLQEYLPDFKIANAVNVFDEASPHMHVVGVPVGRGFKRGLSTKVSKRSVFTPQVLSEVLQDKMRADAN